MTVTIYQSEHESESAAIGETTMTAECKPDQIGQPRDPGREPHQPSSQGGGSILEILYYRGNYPKYWGLAFLYNQNSRIGKHLFNIFLLWAIFVTIYPHSILSS